MSFLETPRFPDDISYRSKGGPMYNTTVITVDSGHEKRNINWQLPLANFDVAYGVKTQLQLYSLIEFFHAVAGRGYGFRYKDWSDFTSIDDQLDGTITKDDQLIGTGDAAEVNFQLIKTYSKGVLSRARNITKPISGTVLIAVDGVLQTETTHYTIDYATGIVTFVSAPGNTLQVTAGYEFDVPVRFDSDELETQFDHYDVGSTKVTLTEIRV